MSLEFHKPSTTKKMKKRKELDALVSSEKLSTKYANAANGGVGGGVNHRGGGSSGGGGIGRKTSRTHQLLEESASNSENEMQQGELSGDGDGEVYSQIAERRFRRRQHTAGYQGCGACGRNCVSFLGVCSFLLSVAGIAAIAGLAWMQMELKREVSLLRDQVRHAGESDRGVGAELVDVKNKIEALDGQARQSRKTLVRLDDAVTKDHRAALDGLRTSLEAVKKSVSSTSEFAANLPRDLQTMKKEVAKVGSNVATLQKGAEETRSKMTALEARSDKMEKAAAKVIGGETKGKEMNASLAAMKSGIDDLNDAFYGPDKLGGINGELKAVKGRVDSLFHLVEDIHRSSSDKVVTTEKSSTPTSSTPLTSPTPLKQNNSAHIISAHPHDVTGVVGETTTSSSPASELASTSVALQQNQQQQQQQQHEDKLSRIESLLAANQSKHKP